MRYFITVTEDGITLPKSMKPGRYEAVLISDKTGESLGLISIKDLRRRYYLSDKNMDALFSRMCNSLCRTDFKYLNDFEGKDILDIIYEIRDMGTSTTYMLAAFCKMFEIEVIYKEAEAGIIDNIEKKICKREEYEPVPVVKEEHPLDRVKVEDPSRYYEVYHEDGTRDYSAVKMVNYLHRRGIHYLNEFEGADIDERIRGINGIGFKRAVAIIAFCIKYGIGVVYSEEKYGTAVREYLKCIREK